MQKPNRSHDRRPYHMSIKSKILGTQFGEDEPKKLEDILIVTFHELGKIRKNPRSAEITDLSVTRPVSWMLDENFGVNPSQTVDFDKHHTDTHTDTHNMIL